MSTLDTATVVIVPGLRDHVAEHWQTLMAAEIPGSRTVEPLEHDKLSCAARVEALHAAISSIEGPIILAAHSAGCLMVAHWAERYAWPIRAALLATPADIEKPLPAGYPVFADLQANGWLPIPRRRLPFPTIVCGSINDPLAETPRVMDLAESWGAEFRDLGAVGHLNPIAGYGPWPEGLELLRHLNRWGAPAHPTKV
jgi:predicted alpha/beta hydrolase family esterase